MSYQPSEYCIEAIEPHLMTNGLKFIHFGKISAIISLQKSVGEIELFKRKFSE